MQNEMLENLWILAAGFAGTLLILPFIMRRMRAAGIVGVDAHKRDRPVVPEMGGISVLIGLAVSASAAYILYPTEISLIASFLFTALIAGAIGILDDLKTLSARVKPLLTLLACAPILILRTYNPHPLLPIIGELRLTIVYPLAIPLVIAVTSNGVNMMDPFNGTMSGTCTITVLAMIVSAFILGRGDGLLFSVCLIGPLLAFYYFNRYPSRVFSGDVGSLSIGAALGAIAIIGRLELVAAVAFMPQIMNAFYGLSSMGRLYERHEVSRPTTILDDGRLMASADPKAPITLARVILARGPLRENEAVRVFFMLSLISGILAIFTAYLMTVTT